VSRRPEDLEHLSAWFDGEVGEVEADEVRARLLDDPALRAQLQEWRGLREKLQALQPEPLGAARMAELHERLVHATARDARALDRAIRVWTMAAALLVVVGAGWLAAQARLGFDAGEPAFAREPREIERAIEELLAPMPGTPVQRPAAGTGRLRDQLRSAAIPGEDLPPPAPEAGPQ
jgi:hypothetical protein